MGLLTATEVAKRLGRSDKTIRAWIAKGDLPAVHISATQLGIREEDMYRLAQHKGIDLQEARPGDSAQGGEVVGDLSERIAQLEQELAALRNEITLLKSVRESGQERATMPIDRARVSGYVEKTTRQSKRTVEPLDGVVSMRAFAQEHGVNPRTMFDHVTKGISGDRIEVIERPKPNRPRETERLLTPAMQEQAIAFWQRHDVVYTPCSACPHSQDVDSKSAPVDASKKETERFYVEDAGGSWAVRDSEIWYRGQAKPHLVQWHTKEQEAHDHAQELNRTRGHAVGEPKCIECGAQPAGGDGPRCAYHHSRLADMHG